MKICLKAQRQVCLLATILTKAGAAALIFCAILCAETSTKSLLTHLDTDGLEHVDSNVLTCPF